MKKIIYLSVLALATQFCANKAMAQLPFSFTQYMNNLTPVNAAASTMDDAANVNIVGRKQWIGINGAPNTFLFNGAVPLAAIGSTVGADVLNDNVGNESLTEMNVFFAKKIQLSGTNFLSVAINGGFRSYKNTNSTLDPTDPKFRSDVSQSIANAGFGVMFYGSDYFIGASIPRFSFNTTGNTYLQNTFYLTAGYLVALNDDFKLKPAGLLNYSGSNLPLAYDISTTLYVKDVVGLGVNYHNDSNIAGILSINLNNSIMLGYSYQFSMSNNPIGGINNSTQEISLGFRFGKKLNSKLL